MTLEEKLNLIADTIDVEKEKIKADTILLSLEEWDSMAKISIIAMLDKKFKKVLDMEQLEEIKSVQDIVNYMAE